QIWRQEWPLHQPTLLRQPLRVRADVLLGPAQILGRVDGEPEPVVAERSELPFRSKLGKRGRLVVAALGEARESFLPEHVDAAADPALDRPALGEAADSVAVELDDAERRLRLRDRDRRGNAGVAMLRQQPCEVDVEQLIAVQGEDVAGLAPLSRREPDASAPPQALGLLCDRELRTDPVQCRGERLARARVAAENHALDAGTAEQADLPGRERTPGDRYERLRQPARGVAEALGLAARQNDRLH